ncbi:MAG: thioredoxin fold domain-containing protein [Gracilimonas sp.]|uniref:thioredoxin family protein n=1 Tax=Gracilimonas sp. TaxID=1974203 RepID=UPI001985056F|nr:thioredoxin fold domain-containing protein [Gracilimonas sp.]MBD3617585.1 thioredoxin fold domain-containing protein [Gracilimonas sp.]
MIFRKAIFTLLFFTIAVAAFAQSQDRPDMFEWHELGEAQKLAAENDKKVLVYANARWCTYCKKMEKEVFSQKSVQDLTNQHFYIVWIDIESDRKLTFRGKEMTEMEFSRGMRITGTPTFIFIDSEGEIIAGQPGFIPEDMYSQILKFVGKDAYLDQSFEEFIEK